MSLLTELGVRPGRFYKDVAPTAPGRRRKGFYKATGMSALQSEGGTPNLKPRPRPLTLSAA